MDRSSQKISRGMGICVIGEKIASRLGKLAFINEGRLERAEVGRFGYFNAQRRGGSAVRGDIGV